MFNIYRKRVKEDSEEDEKNEMKWNEMPHKKKT